jgi:hypothetical protein
MMLVTSARICATLVGMSAANSDAYPLDSAAARKVYESESNGDVYRAMKAEQKSRRACKRGAAVKALTKLAPKFESLGVVIKPSGGDAPHTYELFAQGRRLLWWWPSRGKTRLGATEGPVVLSAKSLLDYVQTLVNSAHLLSEFALANWIATQIEDAKVWQPKGANFARVYKNNEYLHITKSTVDYTHAGAFADDVRALLALHRVNTTSAGYVVGPAVEIAPLGD